jgi:hypothetical protein
VFGSSSGIVVEYRDESDLQVFDRWGETEAERILRRSPGCVWTFETHASPAETDAINAALAARGLTAERALGEADARATRFCPAIASIGNR